MKRINKSFITTLIIILFTLCTKENRTIRKIEGSWNIEYIEIYEPNFVSQELELFDSYLDAGSITFINDKKNKQRKNDPPYTNTSTFEWIEVPPTSITDLYYYSDIIFWSIITLNKEDFSRLQFMVLGGTDLFYYSTYTINWINENELEIYYNIDNSDGYDNSINYREIWKLIKVE